MATMTATQAISESSQTDSIVTLDEATPADIETLTVECDDHVETGSVHEFWGAGWRVHVAAEPAEQA